MLEDLLNNFQTELQYGIKPTEFLSACRKLENKFKIKFDYEPFKIELKSGSAKYHIPSHYISFLYYCQALDRDNVDITYLIKQFRESQRTNQAEAIIHATSIAVISYIYHRNKYSIEFLPVANGGDFKINGLTAELKTLQSVIIKDSYSNTVKVKDDKVDVKNTIIFGITQILRDKLKNAIKQGEVIYFNCEQLPFFSSIEFSMKEMERIVEPKKCRVVFFTTRHYFPGEEPYWLNSEGYSKSLGVITAPDLDKFFGIFFDIDPSLWRALSLN